MTELTDLITTLVQDRDAAGLLFTTRYDSPLPTVTPPAGTLRSGDKDVNGEFTMPDGSIAVTVDSWGSQASRMEAAAETLAEAINYPLVRLVTPTGEILTTSARLSHRHADATWRAARAELETAGIPFTDIQNATTGHADPLLRWYPLSILFGWWHSHIATSDPKKAKEKNDNRLKSLGKDQELAAAFEGYARMGETSRSARLITSEILALGAHRRLRMAAKSDSLFGPLAGGEKGEGGKSTGPSAVGLGSLPPVMASKAPVDVTFDTIEGRWFLSLAGLRRFHFDDADTTTAHTLLVLLGLLLRDEAQQQTRLRAGTELIAATDGSTAQVLRHNQERTDLPTLDREQLIATVAYLGAQVGWSGPVDVTIPGGSVLDRLLHLADADTTE